MKSRSFITAAAAVTLLSWGAVAGAYSVQDPSTGTCTADYDPTNPDASVTRALFCGPGTLNNDDATEVRLAEDVPGWNKDWVFVAKDESANAGAGGNFWFTGSTGGDWFINAAGYSNYLIVIKDGSVGKDTTQWFWFIVDTAAGCIGGAYQYCGSWTMYGDASKAGDGAKAISHMSLYGFNRRPDEPLPEPGTLALLGLGLLGLGAARRRAG